MSFLERLAEQKIRAALERGELDNLPLSGKPLPLEPRGLVPEDLSLAYKLLKDAGSPRDGAPEADRDAHGSAPGRH